MEEGSTFRLRVPDERVVLSLRQGQVLALVADGLTDAEIAMELGIAPRTVRMHVDVLRSKFGVARRRQLLAISRRSRVVSRSAAA
jgi:DNA-binding CsgD family transcriptional regulator